jgi:enoyl-[acyl-carrier-protein] reductase (NADH)
MLKQTDGFRSAQFLTEMPQGCLVDAISVASMAVFLLSEKAKSITGSMVNVDGGYTL